MQAVIMAGGKGTRLASVTKDEIPKPMVPIAGKPLLLWQIEECRRNGIRDVIFITGHLGEQIEAFFRDGSSYGMHISYIREQTPLGTAGSFYALKRLLTEPYFLLVFGDVLFAVDCGRYWKETRGLPAHKVVLGLPFYARPSWADYGAILAAVPEASAGDHVLYNGMEVYYNGPDTIAEKTRYARETLGGVMIWELTQDTSDKENSLLRAIGSVLK